MKKYRVNGLLMLLRDIWRAIRGHGVIVLVTWDQKNPDSIVEFGQFPSMGPRRLEVHEWHRWESFDQGQMGHFTVRYHDPDMRIIEYPAPESMQAPKSYELN